ncbi:ABC transporter substrate-binding protein [Actinopolymorpha alba]|uniref:ABC transporter substrate-binding protein n=1 Tax=Actinopolymorpha alba TaxID=533267 RepID=UPI0003677919|nr:sugar ABC transporter substrate-binding protein [Actinopolymorpha alba]
MRHRVRAAAALVAAGALIAAGCGAGSGTNEAGSPKEPISLRFQSLAFQPESIAANKEIVAEWNKANPNVKVEYVQGDWGSVQDQLVTGFEGGTAPDIFHYESSYLRDFADRGNLLDLNDYLTDKTRRDIRPAIWDTATFDDGVYGMPFLLDAFVVFANKKLLDEAGIKVPAPDDPWTWDEFTANAKKLTKQGRYGAAFALKSPANRILNLSLNFDGKFFAQQDDKSQAVFGAPEKVVLQRIHDMLYKDKIAAPEAIGMGGADTLPAFFDGKFAMVPSGIWLRQQIIEQAPKDFEWVTIPALKGTSQTQAAAPQTLSVSADTKHPEEAVKFMEFFLSPKNQARLANGDAMVPASQGALDDPVLTKTPGWEVAVASGSFLQKAPFQTVKGYEEWKNKIANPSIQEYFQDRITIDQLGQKLVKDGNGILERYQR